MHPKIFFSLLWACIRTGRHNKLVFFGQFSNYCTTLYVNIFICDCLPYLKESFLAHFWLLNFFKITLYPSFRLGCRSPFQTCLDTNYFILLNFKSRTYICNNLKLSVFALYCYICFYWIICCCTVPCSLVTAIIKIKIIKEILIQKNWFSSEFHSIFS